MKIFSIPLSILIFVLIADNSFSEPWKAKKFISGNNSSSQAKTPIQGYHMNSQPDYHATVYNPDQRPPVDLSESNHETVGLPGQNPSFTISPNESPSMTVSIPQNPGETVSIPNSNQETASPLPGSEPEETVEIPNGSGH